MFAGHYAPAFALRARYREVPLWQLFLAVQAVDVLFFVLAPLGIERLTIDPTRPGSLALILSYMPWSHSLAAGILWGAVVALVAARIGPRGAGPALGIAVATHWFADLLVHTPDLPVATGDGVRVGLGLWRIPTLSWALEVGLVLVGAALAWKAEPTPRSRRHLARLAAALALTQTAQTFIVPLPTSVLHAAVLTQFSFAAFAAGAWWAERRA